MPDEIFKDRGGEVSKIGGRSRVNTDRTGK